MLGVPWTRSLPCMMAHPCIRAAARTGGPLSMELGEQCSGGALERVTERHQVHLPTQGSM